MKVIKKKDVNGKPFVIYIPENDKDMQKLREMDKAGELSTQYSQDELKQKYRERMARKREQEMGGEEIDVKRKVTRKRRPERNNVKNHNKKGR